MKNLPSESSWKKHFASLPAVLWKYKCLLWYVIGISLEKFMWSEEFPGIFHFRPKMYRNSLLKAIYIMKHTWISRSQNHLNIGSNLALFPEYTSDSETQISTLKKCLFKKKKKEKSFTCNVINIIIKSWCRILKARCILLRSYPTEVIPWEFNYQVLELRLGVRWRFLFFIVVKPFMLWRHQFETYKHVKTSREFRLSYSATV